MRARVLLLSAATAAALVSFPPVTVGAQHQPAPAAAHRALVTPDIARTTPPHAPTDTIRPAPEGRFGTRLFGGTVGAVLGGIAGAYAARGFGGDDWSDAFDGAMLGSMTLAAAMAAAPPGRSACSYSRRLFASLLGAGAGTALGILLVEERADVGWVMVPAGIALGAALPHPTCGGRPSMPEANAT